MIQRNYHEKSYSNRGNTCNSIYRLRQYSKLGHICYLMRKKYLQSAIQRLNLWPFAQSMNHTCINAVKLNISTYRFVYCETRQRNIKKTKFSTYHNTKQEKVTCFHLVDPLPIDIQSAHTCRSVYNHRMTYVLIYIACATCYDTITDFLLVRFNSFS